MTEHNATSVGDGSPTESKTVTVVDTDQLPDTLFGYILGSAARIQPDDTDTICKLVWIAPESDRQLNTEQAWLGWWIGGSDVVVMVSWIDALPSNVAPFEWHEHGAWLRVVDHAVQMGPGYADGSMPSEEEFTTLRKEDETSPEFYGTLSKAAAAVLDHLQSTSR